MIDDFDVLNWYPGVKSNGKTDIMTGPVSGLEHGRCDPGCILDSVGIR